MFSERSKEIDQSRTKNVKKLIRACANTFEIESARKLNNSALLKKQVNKEIDLENISNIKHRQHLVKHVVS